MDANHFLHSFLKASELPNASQKPGPLMPGQSGHGLSGNPQNAAQSLVPPAKVEAHQNLYLDGADSAGGPPIAVKPPVPGSLLMGGGAPPAETDRLAAHGAAGGGDIVKGPFAAPLPVGAIPPALTANTASPQTVDTRVMPPGGSLMPGGTQGMADTREALPVATPGKQYLDMYLGKKR